MVIGQRASLVARDTSPKPHSILHDTWRTGQDEKDPLLAIKQEKSFALHSYTYVNTTKQIREENNVTKTTAPKGFLLVASL